jgi:hypothetical protein
LFFNIYPGIRYPATTAIGMPNGAIDGPAKLTAKAIIQKQIPPKTNGLNLIINPDTKVGNPASNRI